MRLILLLTFIVVFAWAEPAWAEGVALSFDDLPGFSLSDAPAYSKATLESLLRGLRRHRLPAIGFVIAGRLVGRDGPANIALVKRWQSGGMMLGNHSFSHASLFDTPIEEYIADVRHADQVMRAKLALRRPLRWYRHPYLETGATLADRQKFERWLAAHGYRAAPVTMENADWMFALPYDDAIAHHDRARAARVRASYLDYTARVVPWYREAGRQILGRRPEFIFLLHASRLNADTLDGLAAILERNGLHGVTLDQAMADRAYRIRDDYAGPDGDEWISRWAKALNTDLDWDGFPEPPADIAAENARLDTSP